MANFDNAKTAPAYRRRKEQRPDEIVEAGLEEFYEHGFSGARLDRIAQRAGVSRATLYLYFENKDSLFEAVAERAVGSFIDSAAQDLSSIDGTTKELISGMVRRFYSEIVTTKNSAIMRILISEGQRSPHLVERYHKVVMCRGRATLAAVIERGLERGEVRDGAAAKFPQLIASPAMFFLISQMVFSAYEELDPDAFIEAHLDLLFNGLLTS